MVSPALQLSVKMPENRLQVWAASLLAGTTSPLTSPHLTLSLFLPPPSTLLSLPLSLPPSLPPCLSSFFIFPLDLYHTTGEGEKEKLLRQQSNAVLQQLERG